MINGISPDSRHLILHGLSAVLFTVSLVSSASAQTATNFFLHGTGADANPPTLFLDTGAPTASTAKYKDSAGVNFAGGNPWIEVGTWPANPVPAAGTLTALAPLHVWLGLKNSDDQGTNYDVRAELTRNGVLVVTGQTLCITSITRNPANALDAAVSFGSFAPQTFNGTSDGLSLKISTRIGTNPDGTKCAGHNNAVGLRLYFDATSRASKVGATLGVPNPVPTALAPDPLTITVGATGALTATLSPTPDTSGSLAASSSAPNVATVPASVAFSAGQDSVSVPVSAVNPGNTLITVSLNGGSVTSTVQVTPAPPTITSLVPDTVSITQGGSGTLTVTISSAQTTDTAIALSSSAPAIAFVPSSVTVPASQLTAPIAVSANSPGNAQITASLNGTSAASTVTVTPAPPTVISVLPAASSVTLGATTSVTVTISGAQPTDTVVALSANPSGIITVPATVTVPAGQTTADISVGTVALGTAMVRASLNGTTSEAAVQVVPPPPALVSLLPSELSIVVGATGTVTATLNAAQPTNTVIILSVDQADWLLVPSSVTVPAGEVATSFTVTGLATGTAVITGSLNGTSQTSTISVIPPPPTVVSLLPDPLSIQQDSNGTWTLTINAAQPSDTVIPLTNSAPTVAQAPTSVTVPAGNTSLTFAVFGLSPGNATVTASINATTVSATVQVTPSPTIVTGLTPGTLSLPTGSPGVLHVAVAPTSPDPQIVTVTSNNTTVAQVPATVTIPAGDAGADFPVVAVGEGSAAITATLDSGSASAQVTVTPAELTTMTVSPDAPTIVVGETLSFTATGTYTDGTTQNLTATVTWSSSNQAVALIDTTGVATAIGGGTTTITATSGAISGSTWLTVPPPPTISGFTPTSGQVGTTVTISGANFGATATVLFHGVPATISDLTSTAIATSVPAGATTGPITVTTAEGTATSAQSFYVIQPPTITSFTPTSGPIGTAVTITGDNFNAFTPGDNQLQFNGTRAIITSVTPTTITTTVPLGATTGPVTVTTPFGTGTSAQPFTVTPRAAFTLDAAPAVGTVLQGAAVTYVVTATGVGDFSGLISLGVAGLPAGSSAVFDPPMLAAGRRATLTISTSTTTPVGTASFVVAGTASLDTGPSTQTVPLAVAVQAGGRTAVAGQFVTVEGEPIPGVVVRLGAVQTMADAAGNFLLADVPSGTQQLMIDANAARAGYPMYAADVTLVASETTILPPFRITPPPPAERFTPIANATQAQVITDLRYPGVSLTLPAGVTITGWDGVVKTQIALERLDPDHLPVLPPPGGTRSLYQIFFGTPMGGMPSAPLPVAAPNDLDLEPGQTAELWYYDASPLGGAAGWRQAGLGTVSNDGTQIVSNAGVGIQRFCGVCGLWCWIKRQDTQHNLDPNGERAADPVDLTSGLHIIEKTDLVLPGRLPVVVSRTYNPDDPFGAIAGFQGALGPGWTLSVDVFLLPMNTNLWRLILPGNSRIPFVRQPDGTFQNTGSPRVPQFIGAVLTALPGGEQQLRFKDGTSWRFRTLVLGLSYLIEQADRVGNRVTIYRTSGGRIQGIEDAAGRGIAVQYTGNRVTHVRDPLGRIVQYGYDGTGRLVTVTDPAGGVTTYTYAANGGLATITDARGITYLRNEYNGRYVVKQTLADGGVYRFYYRFTPGSVIGVGCPGPEPGCPFPAWQQIGRAGSGVVIPQWVETVVVDPRGHQTRSRLMPATLTQGSLTPVGGGRAVVDALGQETITEQNAGGQPLAVIDPLGRTTRLTYDAAGNVTSVTDPAGHVTAFGYEPTYNRLTTLTDAVGQVTTFEYDAQGNLTATVDPLGARTTLAYNTVGQPTGVTDALGNTTSFEYDAVGNLIATSDPLGHTTRRAYDAVSRLTALTDANGNSTQYTYDALNRVTEITDALANLTRFTYDANGNLLSVADAKGQTTTYTYDNMDRLSTRTDALNRVESYVYDLNGNLATFTDRKGQLSQFTYDALNRRSQAAYADGASTTFTYDAVGRLGKATDSTVGAIEWNYDLVDRLVQELTPQGAVQYTYDALGRRTTMTANGQASVGYQYDAASRLTRVSQGLQIVGLSYDAAGRRTGLSYPNGTTTTYGYDAASRLTSILHQGPTAVIEALTYTYDAAGNRLSFARANQVAMDLPGPVQAAYDAANEQIQFNNPTPNLTYDANGNLTSQTDTNGTTTYTWDARNRLAAVSGPDVSASFVYDAVGRRVSKTINEALAEYQYGGNDIIAEMSSGTVAAVYIRSLNIDEPFARQSNTNEYYHTDALGSTLALTDDAGAVQTTYGYDPFGNTTVAGASTNPFQYVGREHDTTDLYYYRARYYSPVSHRFISGDLIRQAGENLYLYVKNRPLAFIDPLGLELVEVFSPSGGSFTVDITGSVIVTPDAIGGGTFNTEGAVAGAVSGAVEGAVGGAIGGAVLGGQAIEGAVIGGAIGAVGGAISGGLGGQGGLQGSVAGAVGGGIAGSVEGLPGVVGGVVGGSVSGAFPGQGVVGGAAIGGAAGAIGGAITGGISGGGIGGAITGGLQGGVAGAIGGAVAGAIGGPGSAGTSALGCRKC